MFYLCASITVFVGLPANFLVLLYFTFGQLAINRSMKTLHIWIVVTDMLIAASLLPFAMKYVGDFKLYTDANHVLCEVMEFSGDMWIRLSFFLICMMSLVRLRLIRRINSPGCRQREVVPLNKILVGAFIFFAVQSIFPIALRHLRAGSVETCISKKMWEKTFPDAVVRKVWRIFTILLEVVIAMTVIIVANGASIFYLFRDEGRRLSSAEKLAIKWINSHFLRKTSEFDEPSEIKITTFAARMKAASITFMLAFVFFTLHMSGVINTSCKVIGIHVKIDGNIANSISYLTPAVQCIVYGLKFKGFWVFWAGLLRRCVVRVKVLCGCASRTDDLDHVMGELMKEQQTPQTCDEGLLSEVSVS